MPGDVVNFDPNLDRIIVSIEAAEYESFLFMAQTEKGQQLVSNATLGTLVSFLKNLIIKETLSHHKPEMSEREIIDFGKKYDLDVKLKERDTPIGDRYQ